MEGQHVDVLYPSTQFIDLELGFGCCQKLAKSRDFSHLVAISIKKAQ